MNQLTFSIGPTPATLRGPESGSVFLFVHSPGGNRRETAPFAELAVPLGWQVLSVDLPGRDNAEAAFRLEQEFGILTRCGLHCAPAAHRSLGTFPQGTIRFSLGFANTEQDVDAAVAALRAISAD